MYQEEDIEDCVIVRNAVSEDALGIMELHNSVIEEGYLAWSEPKTEDLTLAWLDRLDKLQYPVLVALKEDHIIGCGAFEPVWDTRADAGCSQYRLLRLQRYTLIALQCTRPICTSWYAVMSARTAWLRVSSTVYALTRGVWIGSCTVSPVSFCQSR